MGRQLARDGWIYEIAQWYPRMAVYDDVDGWDLMPYLGAGEFYLEYGNIDYTVTAPADMVVVGSGELLNPGEVLTPVQQGRLAAARRSEQTLFIRTAGEAAEVVGQFVRELKGGAVEGRGARGESTPPFRGEAAKERGTRGGGGADETQVPFGNDKRRDVDAAGIEGEVEAGSVAGEVPAGAKV